MKSKHPSAGFTIIEIVLVLAVAGLIFAVIFIAYPQLTLQHKTNGLKDDARKLVAAVNECLLNTNRDPAKCDEVDEVFLPVEEFSQAEEYDYGKPEYGNRAIFIVKGPVWLFNTYCWNGKIAAPYPQPRPTAFTVSIWLDPNRKDADFIELEDFEGRPLGYCQDGNSYNLP